MSKSIKLSVAGLSKVFRDKVDSTTTVAIKNISLNVEAGQICTVIGPSGCGKTTLLDCIADISQPTSGLISIDDQAPFKGAVSYLMQDGAMLPWRTTLDNVALALELQGIDKHKARIQAHTILKEFGLTSFELHYPYALSGGMLQRAALARTYLFDRDIMLLDEPFGKLDAITKMNMYQWFLNIWQKHKKTVLLVTHDIDEAILMSDRIYVLSPRPGKIIGEVNVLLPRPRKQEMLTNSQFTSIKKRILELLNSTPADGKN